MELQLYKIQGSTRRKLCFLTSDTFDILKKRTKQREPVRSQKKKDIRRLTNILSYNFRNFNF